MPALPLALIAVVAYLLGSIPFGFLLVRIFRSEDIRRTGSGNIGATNVVRSGAKGLGAATFLLDALKGFFAVVVAHELMAFFLLTSSPLPLQFAWRTPPPGRLDTALGVAAISAVLGHIYPLWLRFKGGKGVATAFGALLALAPLAALVGLAVFILVVLLSRYVSLASICGTLSLTLAALVAPRVDGPPMLHRPWLLTALLVIAALVIAKHRTNIDRLVRGTEYRFGKRQPAASRPQKPA